MKNFIVYSTDTGEILRTGYCPDGMLSLQAVSSSEVVTEGSAIDTEHYISNGVITPKQELPAAIDKTEILANEKDVATISGLPNPSTVILDETFYIVTDGAFEFTLDTPGEYIIKCQSAPYLDKELTVNAS